MTRMTVEELRQRCIDNPDFAARNAQELRKLTGTVVSDNVRKNNPDYLDHLTASHDGAERLYGHIRMLAPDLFPLIEREYKFERYRIDLAVPDAKLAIEVNGGRWLPGGGKHGTESDRRKIRRLTLAGWCVLEYSTELLANDPLGIIEEIRAALA